MSNTGELPSAKNTWRPRHRVHEQKKVAALKQENKILKAQVAANLPSNVLHNLPQRQTLVAISQTELSPLTINSLAYHIQVLFSYMRDPMSLPEDDDLWKSEGLYWGEQLHLAITKALDELETVMTTRTDLMHQPSGMDELRDTLESLMILESTINQRTGYPYVILKLDQREAFLTRIADLRQEQYAAIEAEVESFTSQLEPALLPTEIYPDLKETLVAQSSRAEITLKNLRSLQSLLPSHTSETSREKLATLIQEQEKNCILMVLRAKAYLFIRGEWDMDFLATDVTAQFAKICENPSTSRHSNSTRMGIRLHEDDFGIMNQQDMEAQFCRFVLEALHAVSQASIEDRDLIAIGVANCFNLWQDKYTTVIPLNQTLNQLDILAEKTGSNLDPKTLERLQANIQEFYKRFEQEDIKIAAN
jgi:hypothetical protein